MAKQSIHKLKQSFSIKSAEAMSVMLLGDFTDWEKRPISLARQADGVWRAVVPLPPGTYHYRFMVDGEWRDDPACTLRVANPYGSENSVVVVRPASNSQKTG